MLRSKTTILRSCCADTDTKFISLYAELRNEDNVISASVDNRRPRKTKAVWTYYPIQRSVPELPNSLTF
jgi:hypothetical protein